MTSQSKTHHAHDRGADTASVPLGVVLSVEAASFFAAAMLHRSLVAPAEPSGSARVVELTIGMLLMGGALGSWLLPGRAHSISFGAQTTAVFATCLGLLVIAVGVPGPFYPFHLLFNAGVLLLLHLGLVLMSRAPEH